MLTFNLRKTELFFKNVHSLVNAQPWGRRSEKCPINPDGMGGLGIDP